MICFKSRSGSYPTSHSGSDPTTKPSKKREIISEHSRIPQIPEIFCEKMCEIWSLFSTLSLFLDPDLIRPIVLSPTGSGADSKTMHIWIRSKSFGVSLCPNVFIFLSRIRMWNVISIKFFLAISSHKYARRKQPGRGINGYIVVKYEFSWEYGDEMWGRIIPLAPIPFHSRNFGQIFNDDVTVFSPARLFSSSRHGTFCMCRNKISVFSEEDSNKIIFFPWSVRKAPL